MDPLTLAIGGGTILSGLFGAKKDSDNLKRQMQLAQQQREQSLRFIQDQMRQSRGDLFSLFPQAQQSRQQGFNAALALQGASYLPMMNMFQGGNMQAQQALSGALPQMNNAILGQPIDYSQFLPRTAYTPSQALSGLYNPQMMNFPQIQGQ